MGKPIELKVVVHDDGKSQHIRPLTLEEGEGANYKLNKFERIVNLVEEDEYPSLCPCGSRDDQCVGCFT